DGNGGVKTVTGITITQPNDIIITVATTAISCYGANDASITLTVTGGTTPYLAQWDNLANGLYQNNLAAGTYTILITDAHNCTKPVTVIIPEPPIFTINPVVTNITCFGAHNGSINLNIVGGIAPVTLVWSDGSSAGNVRNNLGPGTYTVTISDGKPCHINRTFIILEPQQLVLTANVTHAFDCNDANSGAINLMVAGGTPPFTYAWSNGAVSEDLINIPAGNYLVTVTDAKGCFKTVPYAVTRPSPIIVDVQTNTDFNCETRYVKQTFEAQVSGGIPPYQLVWSSGTVSGNNNQIMNTNQNGMVILQATDALGCTANYTFDVDIPILGTPSFVTNSYAYSTYGAYSVVDPIQFTNTATGDYINIAWNFDDGTVSTEENPLHTYSSPGNYVVTQTVTYPLGCVYVHVITLTVEKGYILEVPDAFTPNDDGLNDTMRPVFKGLKKVRIDIYDTWGSLLYSEEGETLKGWDGKIKGAQAENGNYFCKVQAETFYNQTVHKAQPFTLIK
ncbi:gliding motility-associated C-terminal domain-containing protein, partial [Flavobacterium sp.]|uniref:T9SS type B sorting domain-containing protein n=1 Tax=Flavobacterium sp. TaxID=239 RepID=UPI002B4AC5E0